MLRHLFLALTLLMSLAGLSPAQAQESTVPACSVAEPPKNCKANMWALTVDIPVPNGAYVHVADPGCMNDSETQIQKLIQGAVVGAAPKLAYFSGPISKLVATPIEKALKSQGGDLGRLYSPYAKNGALCAPVVAVIPAKAKMAGYRLFASEKNGPMERCKPGTNCPIDWSKFQTAPVESNGASIRTVNAIFMNWSHNRPRIARMVVFYTLPRGAKPLMEI